MKLTKLGQGIREQNLERGQEAEHKNETSEEGWGRTPMGEENKENVLENGDEDRKDIEITSINNLPDSTTGTIETTEERERLMKMKPKLRKEII